MPWMQDPETNEWVMTDTPPAVDQQDNGGYYHPEMDTLPIQREARYDPVQNEDYTVIDRWVQEAQARGNEVRRTGVGTFEVDSGGNIVSRMPSPYRTI